MNRQEDGFEPSPKCLLSNRNHSWALLSRVHLLMKGALHVVVLAFTSDSFRANAHILTSPPWHPVSSYDLFISPTLRMPTSSYGARYICPDNGQSTVYKIQRACICNLHFACSCARVCIWAGAFDAVVLVHLRARGRGGLFGRRHMDVWAKMQEVATM